MDYRKILLAYMRTVARAEGVTFVCWVGASEDSGLSEDEYRALRAVEEQVRVLEARSLCP